MDSEPDRRSVLQGAGVALVAGVAGYVAYTVRDDSPSGETYEEERDADGDAADTPTVLAAVNDVPLGGGVVLPDAKVVVTRDAETISAFSAVCTHQGCLVSTIERGRIACPCHGSVYDASTGQVVSGPAPRPLAPVAVRVVDGSIVTA